MRIVWLHETEPHGEEVALGSPGSAEELAEEAAAAPAVEGVEEQEVQEEDEDLRAASSAVEEAAEEGGVDTSAPSPGEGCSAPWRLRTRSDRKKMNFFLLSVFDIIS